MSDETSVPEGTNEPAAPASPPAGQAAAGTTDLLESFDVTPPSLVRAIVVGAMSYGFAWAASLVCTALVILLIHIEDGGDDASWWWLLTAPAQLVAMAFRSPAVMSMSSADEDFAFSGSVSTTAPALTILAVALVAAFHLSRRDEKASPSKSTKSAATLSIATALTFVAIGWLLALVLKLSVEDSDGEVAFGAGQFQLILFGLVAISLVALLGRRPWNTWSRLASIPLVVRDAWRAVLTHIVVFSALTIPAAIVWVIVEGGTSVLLALPAVLGNLLVYALTLGHFGTLSLAGAGAFFGDVSTGSDSVWVFTDGADKILLLLVLFAVVAVLAAAAVLHVRGKGKPRTNERWVSVALVYAATGGALTWLGTLSSGLGSSIGAGGSVSFGPAPWFFLAFAVWGLLAELVARLMGSALTSVLPAAWIKRAAGESGPVNVPRESLTSSSDSPPLGADESTPMDPRSKRILIGVAGLIAAIVVAVVGVSIANGMFFGPEARAEAYFKALQHGDADQALKLARVDLSSAERVLLTDEVLKESSAKIGDINVGDVEKSGDIAEVTVEFTLDGAEHSQEITLKKSGSRYGVFDDWELLEPELGSIYVTATDAKGLEVNGQAVNVSGLEDGATLPVFPGTYAVTPTAGSKYLTFSSQDVTVVADEESLDFEASGSPDLVTEVTRQADEFLSACIAQKEAQPDGCPNYTYEGFDLEGVKWTLDKKPSYSVTSDPYDGVTFETSEVGSATIKAQEASFYDGDPSTPFSDTVKIEFSGSVTIEGDTVSIDVEDYFF